MSVLFQNLHYGSQVKQNSFSYINKQQKLKANLTGSPRDSNCLQALTTSSGDTSYNKQFKELASILPIIFSPPTNMTDDPIIIL